MTKRIAVIGKGTAGSLTASHFLRYAEDCELDWYYDPSIAPQSVGEGSGLPVPINLYNNTNFNYADLDKIDGTIKLGIFKSGWGEKGTPYLHTFPAPHAALHFSANALQNFVTERAKDLYGDRLNLIEKNVSSPDEIDADYIVDCSGKPFSYKEFEESPYIPINSAYVTQCYWDYPRFQHTLTIARPHGWFFGIPLKNRCSIGYMYNSDINSVDDIKEDLQNVFEEYNLTPSEDTNSLSFKNYYRKKTHHERLTYNGNASFFLDPMEATSLSNVDLINRIAFDIMNDNVDRFTANEKYLSYTREIETMIMLHYFAGSVYNTEFWEYAKSRGENCIKNATQWDNKFVTFAASMKSLTTANQALFIELGSPGADYGTWWQGSFFENFKGLGIQDKVLSMLDI